jgi:hypothetical protein
MSHLENLLADNQDYGECDYCGKGLCVSPREDKLAKVAREMKEALEHLKEDARSVEFSLSYIEPNVRKSAGSIREYIEQALSRAELIAKGE